MRLVMETMAARTISLLTADVKSRKFIAVSREAMEESLKASNIETKVLARMSNASCWHLKKRLRLWQGALSSPRR